MDFYAIVVVLQGKGAEFKGRMGSVRLFKIKFEKLKCWF